MSPLLHPYPPPHIPPKTITRADGFGIARPGDYLHADEDEIEGFKSRLNERLAPSGNQFSGEGVNDEWQITDTLAQWWRPSFETFMYPYTASACDEAEGVQEAVSHSVAEE